MDPQSTVSRRPPYVGAVAAARSSRAVGGVTIGCRLRSSDCLDAGDSWDYTGSLQCGGESRPRTDKEGGASGRCVSALYRTRRSTEQNERRRRETRTIRRTISALPEGKVLSMPLCRALVQSGGEQHMGIHFALIRVCASQTWCEIGVRQYMTSGARAGVIFQPMARQVWR